MQAPTLWISLPGGPARAVDPRRGITAGRRAEFPLGADDPWLHRRCLELRWSGAGWYAGNVGRRRTVMLRDLRRAHGVRLAPGESHPLRAPAYAVFVTGSDRVHELHLRLNGAPATPDATAEPVEPDTLTIDDLGEADRMLVAAFAESYLSGESATLASLRTDREVAQRLGLTAKAVEHRRDDLYAAVVGGGLIPLAEWRQIRPRNRLWAVIRAVLEAGLIDLEDLELLPAPVAGG